MFIVSSKGATPTVLQEGEQQGAGGTLAVRTGKTSNWKPWDRTGLNLRETHLDLWVCVAEKCVWQMGRWGYGSLPLPADLTTCHWYFPMFQTAKTSWSSVADERWSYMHNKIKVQQHLNTTKYSSPYFSTLRDNDRTLRDRDVFEANRETAGWKTAPTRNTQQFRMNYVRLYVYCTILYIRVADIFQRGNVTQLMTYSVTSDMVPTVSSTEFVYMEMSSSSSFRWRVSVHQRTNASDQENRLKIRGICHEWHINPLFAFFSQGLSMFAFNISSIYQHLSQKTPHGEFHLSRSRCCYCSSCKNMSVSPTTQKPLRAIDMFLIWW